ncbi:hypothetical protein [Ligilactobacillus murinus]|uniref:hypothetical protein n=1 Tax=Ligilactobacillus murinus TaxID=1622 RepID=UPI0012983C9F|nr:hypothetical protein [Ligilactobacillus murinus]
MTVSGAERGCIFGITKVMKKKKKNHDCIVELYHCNYESRVESVFKHKELRNSHHKDDSEWGGTGMYFWDNEGNAEYWKKQKDGKADIFRCYVKFDARNDLLDLTDLNVEKRLDQFIRLASKEPKLQYLKKASIGDKIDFFCEKCNVKLVKFFGK